MKLTHKYILLLVLLALCNPLLAQTGIIKGSIKSAKNEPLIGINVGLEGTTLGAPTDDNGSFIIKNIPAGTYTLTASGVGYTASKQNVLIADGKTLSLNLQLSENQTELEEVIVTGQTNSYKGEVITNIGTRTDTRLLEMPQSIQSISNKVIKDQQLFTVNELTRNMTGVIAPTNHTIFTMRGFSAQEDAILYNGIRGNIFQYYQHAQLWNIESVDIVRGPSSALFSAGNPGGVINMNTKKPQTERMQNINVQYGSWNRLMFSADATGSISRDKKLLYRFVGGYLTTESFRDFQKTQTAMLAPSLQYHFSDKSNLLLEYVYSWQNSKFAYDRGSIVTQNQDGSFNWDKVSLSYVFQSPKDYSVGKNNVISLTFNHRFSDKLKFALMSRYIRSSLSMGEHYGPYGADGKKLDTLFRRYDTWEYRPYNFQTSAFASYKIGDNLIRHTVLAGIDLSFYGNTRLFCKLAKTGLQ
jgi:iron complex outermembrane receptor protein